MAKIYLRKIKGEEINPATGAGLDNYQVYIDNGYLKVKLP